MKLLALFSLLFVPTLFAIPSPVADADAEAIPLPDADAAAFKDHLPEGKANGFYGPTSPESVVGDVIDNRCSNSGCSSAVKQYQITPYTLNATVGQYGINSNTASYLVPAFKESIQRVMRQTQVASITPGTSTVQWAGPQYVGLISDVDCDGTVTPLSILQFQTNAIRVGDGFWCDPNFVYNLANSAKAAPSYFSTHSLFPANSYGCQTFVVPYA